MKKYIVIDDSNRFTGIGEITANKLRKYFWDYINDNRSDYPDVSFGDISLSFIEEEFDIDLVLTSELNKDGKKKYEVVIAADENFDKEYVIERLLSLEKYNINLLSIKEVKK
jgi:hypothetical protein